MSRLSAHEGAGNLRLAIRGLQSASADLASPSPSSLAASVVDLGVTAELLLKTLDDVRESPDSAVELRPMLAELLEARRMVSQLAVQVALALEDWSTRADAHAQQSGGSWKVEV